MPDENIVQLSLNRQQFLALSAMFNVGVSFVAAVYIDSDSAIPGPVFDAAMERAQTLGPQIQEVMDNMQRLAAVAFPDLHAHSFPPVLPR